MFGRLFPPSRKRACRRITEGTLPEEALSPRPPQRSPFALVYSYIVSVPESKLCELFSSLEFCAAVFLKLLCSRGW